MYIEALVILLLIAISEYDLKRSDIPWQLILIPLGIGTLYQIYLQNIYAMGILAVMVALHFMLVNQGWLGDADIPVIMMVFTFTLINPMQIFFIACVVAFGLNFVIRYGMSYKKQYPFTPYIAIAAVAKIFHLF